MLIEQIIELQLRGLGPLAKHVSPRPNTYPKRAGFHFHLATLRVLKLA